MGIHLPCSYSTLIVTSSLGRPSIPLLCTGVQHGSQLLFVAVGPPPLQRLLPATAALEGSGGHGHALVPGGWWVMLVLLKGGHEVGGFIQ